jgi:hypothetical protein
MSAAGAKLFSGVMGIIFTPNNYFNNIRNLMSNLKADDKEPSELVSFGQHLEGPWQVILKRSWDNANKPNIPDYPWDQEQGRG